MHWKLRLHWLMAGEQVAAQPVVGAWCEIVLAALRACRHRVHLHGPVHEAAAAASWRQLQLVLG